ncbi:MAG: DNA polymerase III subunit delta [Marinilabiliales bacterium]|nr:MAG: DNA polymerase III subunit delta [Marinilabiliales bacterium]
MLFKEIVGQDRIKKQLRETVTENRISHAQLFLGKSGTSTLPMAIAYAQYISCENRSDTDSCGTCPSCIKFNKLVHPDLHFVFPIFSDKKRFKTNISDNFIHEWRDQVLKDPNFTLNNWLEVIASENKQGMIYVDESAAIIRKLNLKTYESDYKIMIIWLPERLKEGATKLLKIIEEPPEKTLFIMVSENTERILPTILSRVQVLKFSRIEKEALTQYLIDNFNLDKDKAAGIVRLSEGNIIKAKSLIEEQENNQQNFHKFQLLMRTSYTKNLVGMHKWAEDMAKEGREKQKSFLVYAMRMTRECFMLNYNEDITFLADYELSNKFISQFPKYITATVAEKIYNELNKTYIHIQRNSYGRLTLFDTVLKLMQIFNQSGNKKTA